MNEKLKTFFQDLNLKGFMKKVFTRKRMGIAAAIIVILVVLRISFSLIFEVNGIVKKVEGSNITVANFLYTKTVNVGDYPIANIQVGERIKINKNISGDILSVRGDFNKQGIGRGNFREKNIKGKKGLNKMEKGQN